MTEEERESDPKSRENVNRKVLHSDDSAGHLKRSSITASDPKSLTVEDEVEEREYRCAETVERAIWNTDLEKEEGESNPKGRENVPRRVLHPVESATDLRRSCTSAVDQKRLSLEAEVEILRERLKFVQRGRESLGFSLNYSDKENSQLQQLEEVASQLREIRRLTEPSKAAWQVIIGRQL